MNVQEIKRLDIHSVIGDMDSRFQTVDYHRQIWYLCSVLDPTTCLSDVTVQLYREKPNFHLVVIKFHTCIKWYREWYHEWSSDIMSNVYNKNVGGAYHIQSWKNHLYLSCKFVRSALHSIIRHEIYLVDPSNKCDPEKC